jgi:hypothetical protein
VRWLRQPVLHFAAIGALLFALETQVLGSARAGAGGGRGEPVVISAQRVAELRRDWLARTGRLPTQAELRALVGAEIDDELLLCEARARGLHRSDPIVRRRLVRNLRFLSEDPSRSDQELLREALALGMDRTDLVVRRRLIQKMTLLAQAAAAEPTWAELEAFLARNRERFTQPARVRISHVYLSRDRRGDSLEGDARALFDRLIAESVGPQGASELGDPFLLQHHLPLRSERELAKGFGPEFARRVLAEAPGAWSAPVASSYGVHLVWVHERTPALPSSLASVVGEVRAALLAERGESELRARLRRLRSRAAVRVEGVAS